MFRKLFGGKAPAGPGGGDGGKGGRATRAGEPPWTGAPDFAVANFALGDLILNLPRRLTVEGRIHAETLIGAIGAIAGYAAQQALFEDLAAAGETPETALKLVTLQDGRIFYFGDRLNERLVPPDANAPGAFETLWPMALGGADAAGMAVPPPSLDDMFARVASALGGEAEGKSSVYAHPIHLPAGALLALTWPVAMQGFNAEGSARQMPHRTPVSKRWWPSITARTANRLIRDVAPVLLPADALTILMEAAIYASKLPAEVVERKAGA